MIKDNYQGLENIQHRAALNAMEFNSNKPIIGVISAQSEMVFAHADLDKVVKKVCEGIIGAGGIPKVTHVTTVGSSTSYGTVSAKYDLPMRENIAESVELIASNEMLDAIIFVGSDNSTTAGMLMGAIRVNLPSIFVCGGPMSPIVSPNGKHVGISFWYQAIGKIKAGKLDLEQTNFIENTLPTALGTNCEDYGANSFNCILEALGLALPGNSTLFASSVNRNNLARQTGEAIVGMIEHKLVPSKVITKESMITAICFDLAMGGCSTTLLHLLSVANEMKTVHNIPTINLNKIEELTKSTPVLCQPNDSNLCYCEQFHNAGGVYEVLKQLELGKIIKCDYRTYDNRIMSDKLKSVSNLDSAICSVAKPISQTSYIRVLGGNLAPNSALLRYKGQTTPFIGPAKVYENEEMATQAILAREIKKGNVLVIRNEGPKGCPGMREMFQPQALLFGLGLDKDVAVVTDGRISTMYDGYAVGHITPESYDEGPLSIVQDGDVIEISPTKAKINIELKAKDIARRNPSKHYVESGTYLQNYSRLVSTASEGCVLRTKK